MKNPFKRNGKDYDPNNPPLSADGWSPLDARNMVFDVLGNRLGKETEEALREDFQHHIDEDPINGVEAAWMCLCGKLIDGMDKLNNYIAASNGGYSGSASGGSGGVSPFTTFRKDG